jgi:hypothetical protein
MINTKHIRGGIQQNNSSIPILPVLELNMNDPNIPQNNHPKEIIGFIRYVIVATKTKRIRDKEIIASFFLLKYFLVLSEYVYLFNKIISQI